MFQISDLGQGVFWLATLDVCSFDSQFLPLIPRQEKSMSAVQYMVSALNVLCLKMAVGSRTQICRLGENVLIPLLYLWNRRPSEGLKVILFVK